MKKIAIFTEGQTELIFVRNLLLQVMDHSKLSFGCFDLLGRPVPHGYPNDYAEIYFLIVNAGGGEKVLSSMRDEQKKLIETGGYEKIIGLKDMYCGVYRKRSPGVIDKKTSNMIIEEHNKTIRDMTYFNRIKLYFAVMEIEAWFLGMYNLFQKIDPLLTVQYIKQKLGIDLKSVDPQKEFYHPCVQFKLILKLCRRKYKKNLHGVNSICSKINSCCVNAAIENNRCTCFADFYKEITSHS